MSFLSPIFVDFHAHIIGSLYGISYIYQDLVAFYGKLVGKPTVVPLIRHGMVRGVQVQINNLNNIKHVKEFLRVTAEIIHVELFEITANNSGK